MSVESEEPGHGSSVAAWTAVTIMLIGFAIGTVAFFFSIVWLVWASVVLVVLGFLSGFGLARAGYGVGGSKSLSKGH